MTQPNLFLPGDTYRVSALTEEIQAVLQQAYPSIWVAGELQRLKQSPRGHLYLELVEKGDGDRIVGRLDAVIWRADYRRISRSLRDCDQILAEGQEVRCRGNLDFYPAGGRLQYIIREVDPVFTLGLLARRRQAVLADLRDRGLLDRNKSLGLAELALRIGLVTSVESAAYHDFLSSLRDSGYGFRVLVAGASVQGDRAGVEVSRALRTLARSGGLDCLALVRGGGSRSDLAAFDSAAVADAVCGSPLPVLTGLGHEIDQSVADLVAHRAFKTPTSVAEFLVHRVANAEQRLARSRTSLSRSARMPIERGRRSLVDAERGLRVAGTSRSRETRARVSALGRLLRELSPQRTLQRGFTITRDAQGRAIRSAADVEVDQSVTTQLAHGALTSRITDRAD